MANLIFSYPYSNQIVPNRSFYVFRKLLLLGGTTAVMLFAGSFLGLTLATAITGASTSEVLMVLNGGYASNSLPQSLLTTLLLIQFFTAVFGFIGTALIYLWLQRKEFTGQLVLARQFNLPIMILITVAIYVASVPFISWLTEVNAAIQLPALLKDWQKTLTAKEESLAALTRLLTSFESMPMFLLTLVVVALTPAFAEELLFRRCLQPLLSVATKDHHMGIWLTAIIFSGIHMQFFGFLPRVILGALFGYFFFYSGSLWPSIICHFLNNGIAVVSVALFRLGYLDTDPLLPQQQSWYLTIISLIMGYYGMMYLERNRLRFYTDTKTQTMDTSSLPLS